MRNPFLRKSNGGLECLDVTSQQSRSIPGLILLLPFALFMAAMLVGENRFRSGAPQADKTEEVQATEDADDSEPQVASRLVPDQKALLGTKVTTLDLAPMFAETEIGKSGEPVTIELRRVEKEDVAQVTLEGSVLTLQWKSKTGKKREVLIRASTPSGDYIDTKFYVSMWEPDYTNLVLTVLGGLGIFLLGMKNMSEGLQAIAGNRLRKMIGWVTDNRFMAVGVGTMITMLVQSSSITTVTVVGFVNSGFMTLSQAIGVIMGANIGTTITGWILVLKIGKYGLPIAGVAAFVYLFSKRDRLRYLAMTIMGLGLIFLGLELMKDGFAIVKDLPQFEAWFQRFSGDTYLGILKCALVGCVLTFIVQSSSATLGITIGLAQLGVIEFETAAALVLGENIGTTITAWLASFGATTNAKRAAYFHCIFNILGVLWITALLPLYLKFIRLFVTGDWNASLSLESSSPETITAAIAATHTGFNVTNTLLFLPLTGVMAKMMTKLVPSRKEDVEQPRLSNLDVRMLESPAIAIEQSRKEVIQMADDCQRMMDLISGVEREGTWTDDTVEELFRLEDHQDAMQVEFVQFMSNLLGANVPHDVIDEIRHQIRLVDEFESISDCIATVFKSKRHLGKRDLAMPEPERQEILELNRQVNDFLSVVVRAYKENDVKILQDATETGEAITKQAKSLTRNMMQRPPAEILTPFVLTSYSRQIAAYRRVRDHLINIVEVLKGEK